MILLSFELFVSKGSLRRPVYFLAALGRLAPYFERRCVRPATPAVSSVGEAYTCNLAHCRVRLLGRGGVNADAHAAALRAGVESGRLAGAFQLSAAFSY